MRSSRSCQNRRQGLRWIIVHMFWSQRRVFDAESLHSTNQSLCIVRTRSFSGILHPICLDYSKPMLSPQPSVFQVQEQYPMEIISRECSSPLISKFRCLWRLVHLLVCAESRIEQPIGLDGHKVSGKECVRLPVYMHYRRRRCRTRDELASAKR